MAADRLRRRRRLPVRCRRSRSVEPSQPPPGSEPCAEHRGHLEAQRAARTAGHAFAAGQAVAVGDRLRAGGPWPGCRCQAGSCRCRCRTRRSGSVRRRPPPRPWLAASACRGAGVARAGSSSRGQRRRGCRRWRPRSRRRQCRHPGVVRARPVPAGRSSARAPRDGCGPGCGRRRQTGVTGHDRGVVREPKQGDADRPAGTGTAVRPGDGWHRRASQVGWNDRPESRWALPEVAGCHLSCAVGPRKGFTPFAHSGRTRATRRPRVTGSPSRMVARRRPARGPGRARVERRGGLDATGRRAGRLALPRRDPCGDRRRAPVVHPSHSHAGQGDGVPRRVVWHKWGSHAQSFGLTPGAPRGPADRSSACLSQGRPRWVGRGRDRAVLGRARNPPALRPRMADRSTRILPSWLKR